MGTLGTQSQLARIPLADGTLVATPGLPEPDLIPSLMAASDVLGTGWFAAKAAEASPGEGLPGDGPAHRHESAADPLTSALPENGCPR
jgi:hypothetical protein